MKKLFILKIGFVFLCFQWGEQVFAQVAFYFESFRQVKIQVTFRDSSYQAVLDESGVGTIQVPALLSPGYAVLYGPRSINYFYLIPGGKQSMNKYADGRLEFDGDGKTINEYLNGRFLNTLNLNYDQSESAFLEEWEQLPDRLQSHLDSLPLPESFKPLERKRLYYQACNMLQAYPLHRARKLKTNEYSPQENYYRQVEKAMREDEEAYELWEYRQTFKSYIRSLAEKFTENEPLEQLRYALHYIQDSVRDSRLADYLVHTFMYGHVRNFGAKDVEEFLPVYKEKVNNLSRKAEFDEIYQKFSRLAKGKKAPDFRFSDINGKQVALSGLSGKYVYIDVWATWCAPCCRELPLLQQLEERYREKPIHFVGISIDDDEAAWKRKVKTDNLGGVQLYAGKNPTFRSDYQISLIPRFILIDPEGKIVDVKMSRPSEPKTVALLDSLFQ
ncbi:redoxin family protein [Bacteroides pyogenes F0041]|uniref:Redoxin family protein n=1 Tax=Bacteroides pyogenes F0041 TaxID=1321819 RepID=U2CMU9_9BACE|nr:TlpA disulfide reductase family protein [Bacteroides pyogenes]ERI85870.1 redoxin family protein [Bacteroides pyogenes F0041]MBB3895055.1 thiol-disulfide isomerase/thioredoxin [Bacteroides pyogenes]GAE23188.1 alkyl hydroperoxide reductase/ Thiol specific antioxidant/ Mal allergen [Bacteroides pyogenes JCM 10003]SUV32183.1 thiol-disulfide oxidoreductase [Bacteroides pyogenes]